MSSLCSKPPLQYASPPTGTSNLSTPKPRHHYEVIHSLQRFITVLQVALSSQALDWSTEPRYVKKTEPIEDSDVSRNSTVVLLYIIRRVGKEIPTKGGSHRRLGDKVYLAFAFAETPGEKPNNSSKKIYEEQKQTQWVNVISFDEQENGLFRRYMEVLLHAVAAHDSQIHCFTQTCQDEIIQIASTLDSKVGLDDYIESNIHSSFPSYTSGLQNVHDHTIKWRLPYRFYFDLLQMKSDMTELENPEPGTHLDGETFFAYFSKDRKDLLATENKDENTNPNSLPMFMERGMVQSSNRRDRTVMRVCNVIHIMRAAFSRKYLAL